jgi:hypothetical protein
MTPAELTLLADADARFNDPDKAKQAPQGEVVRIEDLIAQKRAAGQL